MNLRRLFLLVIVAFAGLAPSDAFAFLMDVYGSGGGAHLGQSMAGAADLNGDGFADFVVGEPGDEFSATGRALIYFGGNQVDSVPDLILGSGITVLQFGLSVAAGADMNGDGHPDIAVGGNGAAYVFFGGPGMDNAPDVVLLATPDVVHFGHSVAFVGDHDGDGYADLAVGAPAWDSTVPPQVLLYEGGPTPDSVPDERLSHPEISTRFGTTVSGAGDVNGDGFDDFMVGDCSFDFMPNAYRGTVLLYFGSASPDTVPDRAFTGSSDSDQFGASLAAAGDLNADGYADILVGAPGNDPPGLGNDVGMFQVFFGGPDMDTQADITRMGRSEYEWFGSAVASAGDLNGDGRPDLVVGAPHYQYGPGRVALFYGGPTVHVAADRWLYPAEGGLFGRAVAIAGDVNGDGLADLLAGAPHYSAGQTAIRAGEFVLDAGQRTVDASWSPGTFAFRAPAPSPAGDHVDLMLTLDRADLLDVQAFDAAGRIVARPIANEEAGPGPLTRKWSLRDLPSGVYWLRARFGDQEQLRRVVHLQGP